MNQSNCAFLAKSRIARNTEISALTGIIAFVVKSFALEVKDFAGDSFLRLSRVIEGLPGNLRDTSLRIVECCVRVEWSTVFARVGESFIVFL